VFLIWDPANKETPPWEIFLRSNWGGYRRPDFSYILNMTDAMIASREWETEASPRQGAMLNFSRSIEKEQEKNRSIGTAIKVQRSVSPHPSRSPARSRQRFGVCPSTFEDEGVDVISPRIGARMRRQHSPLRSPGVRLPACVPVVRSTRSRITRKLESDISTDDQTSAARQQRSSPARSPIGRVAARQAAARFRNTRRIESGISTDDQPSAARQQRASPEHSPMGRVATRQAHTEHEARNKSRSPIRSPIRKRPITFQRARSVSEIQIDRAIEKILEMQSGLSSQLASSSAVLQSSHKLMAECGEALKRWFGSLSGPALETAIEQSFTKFDGDASGQIDRKEFSDAMFVLGLRLSDDEYDVLFQKYDIDNSGQINLEEFSQMIKTHLGRACKEECHTCVVDGGSNQTHTLQRFRWADDTTLLAPAASRLQAALARRKQLAMREAVAGFKPCIASEISCQAPDENNAALTAALAGLGAPASVDAVQVRERVCTCLSVCEWVGGWMCLCENDFFELVSGLWVNIC